MLQIGSGFCRAKSMRNADPTYNMITIPSSISRALSRANRYPLFSSGFRGVLIPSDFSASCVHLDGW